MSLKIYNTLTRRKEFFTPLNPPKVGMYVCGVTVYDHCHLGHARALINFDVIYRYLKTKGFEVTFVRNFTDVDDKIISKANEEKISWDAVASKYIASFKEDMEALGIAPPTLEPKATENIDEIKSIIQKLLHKGIAYRAGDDIFYSVRQKGDYGKLSGKKIDDLESGARVEVHEAKKDPLDFSLWKASKPGEPFWEAPWGAGRPGWHIECSAMSMRYLGETFDIHGGGRDLQFPHHENEIAQSESASGKPFAHTWIHNGFVNINAEKMSKSLGNFLTLKDLLKTYHSEVLRLFILSAHYRSPLDYTESNMLSAKQSLNRWYTTLARIRSFSPSPQPPPLKGGGKKMNPSPLMGEGPVLSLSKDQGEGGKELSKRIAGLFSDFQEAMDDDFNTAKIIGQLFDMARDLNKFIDNQGIPGDEIIKLLHEAIGRIHGVLGIFGSEPKAYLDFEAGKVLMKSKLKPDEIEEKIRQRNEARSAKDWKKADAVRGELLSAGIQLKDNPDGTTSWGSK